MLADEMGAPINLPSTAATARELQSIGVWDGASAPKPEVALAPIAQPSGDQAILHSWRQLLDLGTLQGGEENLAGTARPSEVVISAHRAQTLGVVNGDLVKVSTARGTITAPARIGKILDSDIWVPRNSIGSQCIATLGAASGLVVTVVKA
jgi:NADH-quinone oxidoreductase subunit G